MSCAHDDMMEIDSVGSEDNGSLFEYHLAMDFNQSEDSPFLVVPNEILINIFSFLDHELVTLGQVCKFWNSIAFLEVYEKGMEKMEVDQDNWSAIKEFTRAIQLAPTNFVAYFKRGVAYYKENEEEEALKNMRRALKLNPSPAEEHLIRAMLFQIQLEFKSAVEEASKSIELDPYNGAAYYLRGFNRFDLQDYEGSISDLTHCLSLSYPYRSKVLNCRGWCFKVRGDIQRALEDFTLSGRLNVCYTKPFVNKAIVLAAKKEKPRILEEDKFLTECISKHTSKSQAASIYYTRGALRQQWDNYEGAIEDYRSAIQYNYHSSHKAYVSIGWCYEKLNQFDKAIEQYNLAIQVRPNYSVAIEHRAGAKCRSDSKAAEEDCKLAIKVNPKSLSFAYRYLAAVQADNENYTGAIAILSDGIRVNPQDTDMILNRAGYYTCQGIYVNAIKDYNACIKYRPDTHEAWKYRGNVNFAVGCVEEAITDYTRALDFEPDDFGVLNNLAVALFGMGDYDKALQYLSRATSVPESPSLLLDNVRLINYVKEKGQLPRQFDMHMINDPVFERDMEKRMRDATKTKLLVYLKATENPLSLKQRVIQWKRGRTHK